MAAIPIQVLKKNSRDDDITYTAAAASDTYVNDGWTILLVINTNGATRTISITPAQVHGDLATAAATAWTIPATTGHSIVGFLERSLYGTSVTVTPSVTTGVAYAAYQLQPAA